MRPPRLIKLAKTFHAPQQWTLNSLLPGLLLATPPQLVHARVQEHRGNAASLDQPGIFLLRKSPTTKSHNPLIPSIQLAQQLPQSCMFGLAKRPLSRIAKDFRHRAPLSPFNPLVEILKRPAQLFAQSPAHTALAGAHEPDQEIGRAHV